MEWGVKKCIKCGVEKPVAEFNKDKNKKDGLDPRCKICAKAAANAWNKANPDKVRANSKKQRYTRHGLTEQQWLSFLEKHHKKCDVCDYAPEQPSNLCLDHDHKCCPGEYSCGKCIRGLLCSSCNTALGMLKDDPVRIKKLIKYLGRLAQQ